MTRLILFVALTTACGAVEGVGPDAALCESNCVVADADAGRDAAVVDAAADVPDGTAVDASAPADGAVLTDARVVTDADPLAPDADLLACDVLAQDCALDDDACYYQFDGTDGVCHFAGVQEPGEPCETQFDCAPGGYCGSSMCVTLCDFETYPLKRDPRCGPGQICANLSGESVVGACF